MCFGWQNVVEAAVFGTEIEQQTDETGVLASTAAGAVLGISRKYSVPLLEHLDAIRFTRRIADRRVLARSP